MNQLERAREQIDRIDAQMAALFEERMQAVAEVAAYKAATGKPVFDAAREQVVLERNTARIKEEALQPYYKVFLQQALSVSRAYQRAMLGRDVAAYQGVQGAWSHIALKQMFPFAQPRAYATWAEVFDAVEQGDAEVGVLPFENSNAGDVSAVLDLLYAHPGLSLGRMCDLAIRQDLLGVPGASLSEVRTVISHQQALAQSSPFLKNHDFATRAWGNTAEAARYVAEQKDPTLAAIASAMTAELYGLEILAEGINEDGDNTTRFIAIQRRDPALQPAPEAGQRLALLFTVDHKPGKLAGVIRLIGERGFNMECIKSRPLPHVRFEYYFYVQLVCPDEATAQKVGELIDTLEKECSTVRMLGTLTPGELAGV